MPDFDVRQVDPAHHRDTILAFWHEYLPGTPESRLDWMARNPAGAPLWFIASDRRNGSTAGMLSVMPRRYYVGSRQVMAGIMGDFVVPREYRAFGPGITLPATALAMSRQAGIELVYTMPNARSEKIVERAGFGARHTLSLLSKPISSIHFSTPGTARMVRALAPAADAVLRFASLDFFARRLDDVSEENVADGSFDAFWQAARAETTHLLGDGSAAYLNWRYFENPHHRYRLLTARRAGRVAGYSFFFVTDNRLEIFELAATEPRTLYSLVRRTADVARAEDCKAVYTRVPKEGPLGRRLRKCLFVDVSDETAFLVSAADPTLIQDVEFCSGDRNL